MENVKLRAPIRSMDPLHRITIPSEILKSNNIPDNAQFYIEVVGPGILLTPRDINCMVCGAENDLMVVDGMAVCRGCAKKIGAAVRR